MTKNELYALETEVSKNIDRIKREQDEYVKGVEAGIELMFKAVRNHLTKEDENAAKKERKDCINCNRNGKRDEACGICTCTYDETTRKTSDPSRWQPIPEQPKGE